MKIAVSTLGPQPTSIVAPFAGNGAHVVVYDTDRVSFTCLEVSGMRMHAAESDNGVLEMLVDRGIDVLVVTEIALGVAQRLRHAGVRIYECVSATAFEAIQALKLNLLRAIETDTDASHR